MTILSFRFVVLLPLAFLAACGGGGTTSDPLVRYETLTSSSQATSDLGGVALRSNGNTGEVVVLEVTGTTTHNTGETTISDGTYSLFDADGFNGGSTLTDGTSTIISDGTQGFDDEYEYVTAFEQSYSSNGVAFDSFGIGGVVTSASDTGDGVASYSGEAVGIVITSTSGFDLTNGSSLIEVDFGNGGGVDVTLFNFEAINQVTGLAAVAPIDTITVTNMDVSGNRFAGGTLEVSLNGNAVDITGANTETSAAGAFFGYDQDISAPDETGGVVYSAGDNGVLIGQFLAD